MYIESILALQAKAGGNAQLPLAIMTSGDTDHRTRQLLEENAYFGMQEAQVTLLKQEKVLSADSSVTLKAAGCPVFYKMQPCLFYVG